MRVLFLVLVLFPQDTFAYLDPGTLSIIFQAIIGAITGAYLFGKMYWGKIKSLFGRTDESTSITDESQKEIEDHKKAS